MKYDIIGDIHGCADTLEALLRKLGFTNVHGVYSHGSRKAIFLGDFVDRGPKQREVIEIVRPMIESGTALAVMGNHEYNAVAWATPRSDGNGYLRIHDEKNRLQHLAFLETHQGQLPGGLHRVWKLGLTRADEETQGYGRSRHGPL